MGPVTEAFDQLGDVVAGAGRGWLEPLPVSVGSRSSLGETSAKPRDIHDGCGLGSSQLQLFGMVPDGVGWLVKDLRSPKEPHSVNRSEPGRLKDGRACRAVRIGVSLTRVRDKKERKP